MDTLNACIVGWNLMALIAKSILQKVKSLRPSGIDNIADVIYKVWEKEAEAIAQHSENAPQLLQYVLECDCINTRNDVDPKLIEEQLSDRNRSDCRRMSSQVVKRLSNLNETEESFYSRLWDHLQSSCYIDDNERGYALLVVSCNVRLPYHQLDKGIQMSDDQYGEITDRLYPQILRSIQILIRRKGLQRTQVASLLYQQLERLTNDDEKAVYLSHIISFLEKDNETPPKQEE